MTANLLSLIGAASPGAVRHWGTHIAVVADARRVVVAVTHRGLVSRTLHSVQGMHRRIRAAERVVTFMVNPADRSVARPVSRRHAHCRAVRLRGSWGCRVWQCRLVEVC